MGSVRRFLLNDSSVFKFIIDTRNIVVGATNGSEKDTQFILPITLPDATNFVLSVSDGRENVAINNSNSASLRVVTFATPGIYTIQMVGYANILIRNVSNNGSPDGLKLVELLECGYGFRISTNAFYGCSNLIIKAPYINISSLDSTFRGVKEIQSNLSNFTVDKVTIASNCLRDVSTPIYSIFSGFFLELQSAYGFYTNTNLQHITEVIIIAPKLTTARECFRGSNFRGRAVIQSNLLTNIQGIFMGYSNPPSLDSIQVSNVTTNTDFITAVMNVINVDKTLLAWANLPFMQSGVTWNWRGSKYSNNPAVIAAYNKITNDWGVIFTNLTMA